MPNSIAAGMSVRNKRYPRDRRRDPQTENVYPVSLITVTIVGRSVMKNINPLEIVQEHYSNLKGKLKSTNDIREKNVLFMRLINLVGVIQFLISVGRNS